ncbi:hypothetical protein QMK33_19290 [Hymenobacter sp. H14-R3]|uniref:hypothetical protein n=1 Tax=Hymenobacter sp. H14-R3 TaxID=3046308 RepID=UPI0024B8F56C|nr:hypothetical protein [Hymenobacter sp. H14-R3]MDJ0367298.1 hypothetical protein [Hymenobacter sp. H14-R3]
MTIESLLAEYGSYYIAAGQNATRLVQRAFIAGVTESLFGSIVTDDTQYRMAKTDLGRILQAFQPGWTPLGTVAVTPVVLSQFPMKVDLELTPDQIEASWLGFLADNDLDRAKWPVIRWLIEAHILPQIQEDFELNEVYLGKFVAPTKGVPSAAGTAMDGIRTIINQGIANSQITPISLGALPSDAVAFCEYVEAFCRAFSIRYKGRPMKVCMNPTLAERYARGRQIKYGRDMNFMTSKPLLAGNGDAIVQIPIEFTLHTVVGLVSMGTSSKVWATPDDNRKKLSKKSVNEKMVRVESAKREVAIFTDYYKGVGFPLLEAVFANELDLGNTVT